MAWRLWITILTTKALGFLKKIWIKDYWLLTVWFFPLQHFRAVLTSYILHTLLCKSILTFTVELKWVPHAAILCCRVKYWSTGEVLSFFPAFVMKRRSFKIIFIEELFDFYTKAPKKKVSYKNISHRSNGSSNRSNTYCHGARHHFQERKLRMWNVYIYIIYRWYLTSNKKYVYWLALLSQSSCFPCIVTNVKYN